jgi:hypothetical protein
MSESSLESDSISPRTLHGRTGRKKLGGRKEICPTFSYYARPVPKIFGLCPTSPENFGQCPILGVQKCFGHPTKFTEFFPFFL